MSADIDIDFADRKKILDIGNETIREIEKNFEFIKMEFKDENEK